MVLSIAVLLHPVLCPVEEGWDAVPMPFLKGVAVEGEVGAAALIGKDADLVDQVGVERPAGGDDACVGVPDVFVVEP